MRAYILVQVLVVSNGDSSKEWHSLRPELDRLSRLLPKGTRVNGSMFKKELIERVTGRSASLVQFLGHGPYPMSKA